MSVCAQRSTERVHLKLWVTLIALTLFGAQSGSAEIWRSTFQDFTYVYVEKQPLDPSKDAEETLALPPDLTWRPLPADLASALGIHAIDYGSFVSSYVHPQDMAKLRDLALGSGLVISFGIDRSVQLPHHQLDTTSPSSRSNPQFGNAPKPVPGLFLIQFAYPIQQVWIEQLAGCGAEVLGFFQQRTYLVRTKELHGLLTCGNLDKLSWIDSFLTTDRISPEHLAGLLPSTLSLQFAAGTDLSTKIAALPPEISVRSSHVDSVSRGAFLEVETAPTVLRGIVDTDADLLSVTHEGEAVLSDERMGQIVAGAHNGAQVTAPGYRAWLQSKNLLPNSTSPIVAVFDSGYDDGGAPTPGVVDHHPDLETPERLLSLTNYTTDIPGDRFGHGTMVAGIIAAESTKEPGTQLGTGVKDSLNYLYGEGIAPGTPLIVSKLLGAGSNNNKLGDLTVQSSALAAARNAPNGSNLAFFVNQSWNSQRPANTSPPPDMPLPLNEYTAHAQFFDQHVMDANDSLAGSQPMTIVFSAGNFAWDFSTSTIRRDSVASPATAKNVIAVGATASYRPNPDPPLSDPNGLNCREGLGRPPNLDAGHIARIASFSGRGATFGPGTTGVHSVRVKPDLVAPGVRVFSTAPYTFNGYTAVDFPPTGCVDFYPAPADPAQRYYTYGTGTSFSAPVVTAAAALARRWFINAGQVVNPSPAMIKAALVATAESLGNSGLTGSDHRPSPNSGWGRVSLKRLTDTTARFYRDNPVVAVNTGETRMWQRPIQDPAKDTLIVLAWSDPAAPVTASSQAALINDLNLEVEESGTPRFWLGNNFNENKIGIDNGYSYRFTTSTDQRLSDAINNVEAVFIPAGTLPAGQSLILRVKGESIAQGPQAFAIFAYNVQP